VTDERVTSRDAKLKAGVLLIRADASAAMGTGHAMRCLALAQAWQDAGGRAVFVMAEAPSAVQARLRAESCKVISIPALTEPKDAGRTAEMAHELGAIWVAVDGYQFGADYQRALKVAGSKVLFLDDYGHAASYAADLVLNQNLGAAEELYPRRGPETRLLLGPRYSLLRREFAAWRRWKREIPQAAARVLVTMGGSDPQDVTARVVEALQIPRFERIESVIVVGGSNPHSDFLQQLAKSEDGRTGAKITVQADVSNMPELMAWADVAISAAGTTCWELCLLAVPSLLIDVAPNQVPLARELGRLDCAVHLGSADEVSSNMVASALEEVIASKDHRLSLSERARKLVDGFGARRVVAAMRGGTEIFLRRVQAKDARLLWEWANDVEVRAASFSSAPILWQTHMEWLEEKLRQPGCLLLIAEDERGTPLGQIRFDPRDDGDADVNITVAKQQRGCGVGTVLIEDGVREQVANSDCKRIHAFVKPENIASARAFERAGFTLAGTEKKRGSEALHFVFVSDPLRTK
jgi:UDP-2,4-diacetamido-2,4,6-trideoxy-beta-L-altropyranose hydrolase